MNRFSSSRTNHAHSNLVVIYACCMHLYSFRNQFRTYCSVRSFGSYLQVVTRLDLQSRRIFNTTIPGTWRIWLSAWTNKTEHPSLNTIIVFYKYYRRLFWRSWERSFVCAIRHFILLLDLQTKSIVRMLLSLHETYIIILQTSHFASISFKSLQCKGL